MLGWFADIFRLGWGLLYWNVRKSWFRYRRGRSRVPCQNLSDSGRAFETACDACQSWYRPARFRRVCPLLVATPDGLRCSADTADVRPFWGVAARYYAAALMSLYGVAVISVFIFLRTIGYPVSIIHVGVPPLWHKVGQARGWYFHERSRQAFAAGRVNEGLLFLANSYEFDPTYETGIELARQSQAGQPARSDEIFKRLLHDHPEKRAATAQSWFLALLARGDFEKIAALARDETLADSRYAGVWIRALFFASRQTNDDKPLIALLGNKAPSAVVWHPLIEVELLRRAGRLREARAAVERPWPAGSPPFTVFYRASALIELGNVIAALDLLANPGVLDLGDQVTLRLEAFAAYGAKANLNREIDDKILAGRLDAALIKIVCAHLIRHPDRAIFERLWNKIERTGMPINVETVGSWFSVMCAAGVVGDKERLHQITTRLKETVGAPFVALGVVEAFFRGETAERRVTSFLPLLPLPLEVIYALLERYSPQPAVVSPLLVPSP